ncbi:MAG: glycosyltransferase family 87 protein [Ktedonobacterales bacterium]
MITTYGVHGYNDFCQNYLSALSLFHGQTLYSAVHCNLIYKYLPGHVEYNSHPPSSILLFAPFGLLPKIPATMLWGFISLAAYLATGWLLLRELRWPILPGLALFALVSVVWVPSNQAAQWLNMQQVLLLLLTSVWLLEQQRQEAWD